MTSSQQLSWNDGILLASLLYSTFDLTTEWQQFGTCRRPIHWWLIGSYVCVLTFRLAHLAGGYLSEQGGGEEFLLDLRQKGSGSKALLVFTWLFCLPFFVISTLVGSFWLYEVVVHSPTCVPTTFHLWFAGFWLLLCYGSVLVYVLLAGAAWIIERRIRSAEHDLREIAGESDAASRWGDVSSMAGYRSFTSLPDLGLSPAQIKALPGLAVVGETTPERNSDRNTARDDSEQFICRCCDEDCPICINALQLGDTVRRLGACGHVFHRSCIDLWLLRRAECPLCKRSVISESKLALGAVEV